MTTAEYVEAFQHLRQDAVPGRWSAATMQVAPHKPILLIAVLDQLIENPGMSNLVAPTESLEDRFRWYWERVVVPAHRTTMALPFVHLKSDGFWHLRPVGAKSLEDAPELDKSVNILREWVEGATFDEALYGLLARDRWCQHLRSVLVSSHFAPELHSIFLERN